MFIVNFNIHTYFMFMKNNLKKMRQEAGLTQAQVAEAAGLSLRYIAALEAGHRNLNTKRIQQFAKILECAPVALIGDPVAGTRIPILSWVSAGLFTECAFTVGLLQDSLGEVIFDGDGDGKFALAVAGTSMDRVAPDGSLIIVNSRDRTLSEGKSYIFCNPAEGLTTFKRFRDNPPRLEPFSYDAQHESIFFHPEEGLDWVVIGRVLEVRLPL